MSVYGVLICWNDRETIERTTESLSFCDQIVAVDGRYIDFPGDTDHSTDGTVEYLMDAGVNVIFAPGLIEPEKRNQYLIGTVGDWYVHLDADEEWSGLFRIPDADMGILRLHRNRPIHYMDRVRVFRHVPGLHYEGKHYWLRDAEGKTFALLEKPGNNYTAERLEATIIHNEDERSPERRMAKRKYYRLLTKREGHFTEVK